MVPSFWTADTLALHSCFDNSHTHVNVTEGDDLRRKDMALWLVAPEKNRRGVLRLKRAYSFRGFSVRQGEYLERIRHTLLGRLILSEITLRPMEID